MHSFTDAKNKKVIIPLNTLYLILFFGLISAGGGFDLIYIMILMLGVNSLPAENQKEGNNLSLRADLPQWIHRGFRILLWSAVVLILFLRFTRDLVPLVGKWLGN